MYDGIFDDFEAIRRHCKSNGNSKFEESAVFDLLENLYPQHGSAQAVQIILEMLDVQTIRDCNLVKIENVETDSNDSIIEVKVPAKCHPVIDLTDDSFQVETSVIEKPLNNGSNSNFDSDIDSDSHQGNYFVQSDNGLSDSDGTKNFDDLWSSRKYNNEPHLSEFLTAMFEESNQSNQFESNQINSNIPEVSEMLEENNNDPNNNLDGTIFVEDHAVANNANNNTVGTHPVIDVTDNSNSNDISKVEVIDPLPGCSKNTEARTNIRINNEKSLPNVLVNKPQSPVPGCSKDFDESSNFVDKSSVKYHASIITDAACIQEIVPWAKLETINTILDKHRDSPNRKQLALWDLMSEGSNKSTTDSKREKDSDNCTVSKKSMQMEVDVDDFDFLNLSTNTFNQFDSANYNESNDSMGNNELINETAKHNQNSNISVKFESSNVLHFNKTDSKKNLVEVSNETDTYTVPIEKFNFAPLIQSTNTSKSFPNFMNPIVKKEKIETVVSGLLDKTSTIQADETKSKETNAIDSINNVLYNEEKQPNNNLDRINKVIDKFKRERFNEKPEKMNVIQPPKLLLQQQPLPVYVRTSLKQRPYIRPATFSLDGKTEFYVQQSPERKTIIQNPAIIPPRPYELTSNNVDQVPYKRRRTIDEYSALKHWEMRDKRSGRSTPSIPPRIFERFMANPPFGAVPVAAPSTTPKIKINDNAGVMAPVGSYSSTTTETDNYDRSMYNKLRSMFPDIKSSYIKRICKHPPGAMDFNNLPKDLNIYIDHLLKEGHNHLQPLKNEYVEPEAASNILSVDEQYEYLLGIFPNADPTYLRKFVEENFDKKNVFEEFIQQKLALHDYPTKEQYLAKIKVTEQIKEYTSDFNVEKFLEMFPDPFKHFEDEKRICVHQPIAMEFLKSHFQKNKITTICRMYTTNKYNLSLTAKALTHMGQDMKSKRTSTEMLTENIPLLQEMAFVKHKKSIISHINAKKAEEDQLFKELKEKKLLLNCECCFNDECMPTKCAECNENHLFCYDCIIRGTESALGQGEAHIKCFTNCQSEFSLATLQKVLSPTTFSALLKKRQTAEVMAAEVDGLVSCPFCHFASIPPPEDKVFKCLNPECMKETCRQCKELNHVPLRCNEVIKTDKARLLIEEKMTEALLRTCYKCKRSFYKEEGCNKMSCTCGAYMCYVCDKPVKGYDHFNAQGGQNSHLCPLWSDDKRINAEAVRKVAEDYKKVMLEQNPNLKIDTEALMPKLPPRSKGPHDDIPNANRLPEHIRRVIDARVAGP